METGSILYFKLQFYLVIDQHYGSTLAIAVATAIAKWILQQLSDQYEERLNSLK